MTGRKRATVFFRDLTQRGRFMGLRSCDECGAVVLEGSENKHAAWHGQLQPNPEVRRG